MKKKKENSFPFIPDMDCDGDHDFHDFLIFQEQIDSLEKKAAKNNEAKSKQSIKDYSWREYTEDGSDYDIFPEDYETEEEYLDALEDAQYYANQYCDDDEDNEESNESTLSDTIEIANESALNNSKKSNIELLFNPEYSSETQSSLMNHYSILKERILTHPDSIKDRNNLLELLICKCLRFSFGDMVAVLGKETEKCSVLMEIKSRCQNEILELLEYYLTRSAGTLAQKDRMEFLSLFLQAEVLITMGDFFKAIQMQINRSSTEITPSGHWQPNTAKPT